MARKRRRKAPAGKAEKKAKNDSEVSHETASETEDCEETSDVDCNKTDKSEQSSSQTLELTSSITPEAAVDNRESDSQEDDKKEAESDDEDKSDSQISQNAAVENKESEPNRNSKENDNETEDEKTGSCEGTALIENKKLATVKVSDRPIDKASEESANDTEVSVHDEKAKENNEKYEEEKTEGCDKTILTEKEKLVTVKLSDVDTASDESANDTEVSVHDEKAKENDKSEEEKTGNCAEIETALIISKELATVKVSDVNKASEESPKDAEVSAPGEKVSAEKVEETGMDVSEKFLTEDSYKEADVNVCDKKTADGSVEATVKIVKVDESKSGNCPTDPPMKVSDVDENKTIDELKDLPVKDSEAVKRKLSEVSPGNVSDIIEKTTEAIPNEASVKVSEDSVKYVEGVISKDIDEAASEDQNECTPQDKPSENIKRAPETLEEPERKIKKVKLSAEEHDEESEEILELESKINPDRTKENIECISNKISASESACRTNESHDEKTDNDSSEKDCENVPKAMETSNEEPKYSPVSGETDDAMDEEKRTKEEIEETSSESQSNATKKKEKGDKSKTVLYSPFFKVTIQYARAWYSKSLVVGAITNLVAPFEFHPIKLKQNLRVAGKEKDVNETVFYVDDEKVASILQQMPLILFSNPFEQLHWQSVDVEKCSVPPMPLEKDAMSAIKNAIQRRYNASTKHLDLSKFYMDPLLIGNYLCALCDDAIFIGVLSAIVAIFRESSDSGDSSSTSTMKVTSIDLSNNRLTNLKPLSILVGKIENIKILNLACNEIQNWIHLKYLQKYQLDEIVLFGNPISANTASEFKYSSSIRHYFPGLKKLDGCDFVYVLPNSISTYLLSPDNILPVRTFLENYYRKYDSENRATLINDYDVNAVFSIKFAQIPNYIPADKEKRNFFKKINRNLMKVPEGISRYQTLHYGRNTILSVLSQLPQTQHDPLSLSVDILSCTESLWVISVSGVYREPCIKKSIHSFNRVFAVIPSGNRFIIANDVMMVTKITTEQLQAAFQDEKKTDVIPPDKMEMIQEISVKTGMNSEWSEKCLEDTNWDVKEALKVFNVFKNIGIIPEIALYK